jgi:hypothetical protein
MDALLDAGPSPSRNRNYIAVSLRSLYEPSEPSRI